MRRGLKFAVIAAVGVAAMPAQSAVVLSALPYTQNFDSLASSGTANTVMPTGWEFVETGSLANSTYAANFGNAATQNTYSFGAAGSTERALGSIAGPNNISRYGVEFTNGLTGLVITELDIRYFGELWRIGARNNSNTLSFAYSTDATSLTDGMWTNFAPLDFTITPGGDTSNIAVDGNANRTAISGLITGLYILPGQSFYIRWSGNNAANNDHGLSIDDLRLSATTVPEPESWALLIAGFGLVGATMRRRRAVAA